MASFFAEYLPRVRALDAAVSAHLFRKIAAVCDDLCFADQFMTMAQKTNADVETIALPSLIRQAERLYAELCDVCVLLCPDMDPPRAEEMEREIRFLTGPMPKTASSTCEQPRPEAPHDHAAC